MFVALVAGGTLLSWRVSLEAVAIAGGLGFSAQQAGLGVPAIIGTHRNLP